jgi:hypothetical protein
MAMEKEKVEKGELGESPSQSAPAQTPTCQVCIIPPPPTDAIAVCLRDPNGRVLAYGVKVGAEGWHYAPASSVEAVEGVVDFKSVREAPGIYVGSDGAAGFYVVDDDKSNETPEKGAVQ